MCSVQYLPITGLYLTQHLLECINNLKHMHILNKQGMFSQSHGQTLFSNVNRALFHVVWSLTTLSRHFQSNQIAVPFTLHDCFWYHSCGLHIAHGRYDIQLEFLQIKTVIHKKLAIHVVCLLIFSHKTKKKKKTEETLFLNVF